MWLFKKTHEALHVYLTFCMLIRTSEVVIRFIYENIYLKWRSKSFTFLRREDNFNLGLKGKVYGAHTFSQFYCKSQDILYIYSVYDVYMYQIDKKSSTSFQPLIADSLASRPKIGCLVYHKNIVGPLKIHLCHPHIEQMLRLPGVVSLDVLQHTFILINCGFHEKAKRMYSGHKS